MIELSQAYILCGGKSQRLGTDKLFVSVGKQSLLTHTINTCQKHFKTVKLSAISNRKYESFGLDLIEDYRNCQGPLAGIIASLEDCSEKQCFITAVDFPGLDSKLINSLIKQFDKQQYLGLAEPGGTQPLCGIYSVSALPLLLEAANNGVTKVSKAIARLRTDFIKIDNSNWLNINNQADLEKSREIYG